jgi:hypothetical protein
MSGEAVELAAVKALAVMPEDHEGISPHFRLFPPVMVECPPERGRELSSREAVLPLMYRVREGGLQKDSL